MRIMTKILAGTAGLAALAVSTPAAAQYYGYQRGYTNYGYAQTVSSSTSAFRFARYCPPGGPTVARPAV